MKIQGFDVVLLGISLRETVLDCTILNLKAL